MFMAPDVGTQQGTKLSMATLKQKKGEKKEIKRIIAKPF